jgi:hypothetical protein
MGWYFWISHPYMKSLPPRDPLRLCEHESLMEDEVEREGPTAAKLSIDNNLI